MQSTRSSLLKKITPECENFAKRSTTLNMVSIFFAIVTIILIIIALVYNYMPPTSIAADKAIAWVGTMNILALFTVLVTLMVGVWAVTVQNQLKKCILQPGAGVQ